MLITPTSMPRIYFARGVDGLDLGQAMKEGRSVADELFRQGLLLVDPLRTEPVRNNSAMPMSRWYHDIVVHDLEVLRLCAGVLMDMTIPGRNYIGCSCELVYAYLWNIPTAVYLGENDGNCPWLQYHAAVVVKTRAEAVDYPRGVVIR
jgi:hypothetical protein